MTDDRESAWDHIQGNKHATFFTSERKWLNKIHRWAEEYPDEVKIQHINEDGSLTVHLPATWCKISPKKPRNMSQEQRDALRDRMVNMRQKLQ